MNNERPIINIAHAANVNFGSQVGTITATLNQLEGKSPDAKVVVDSLRTMTEAIASDGTLSDREKKNTLEALTFVAAQADLPREERNEGILRPIFDSIPKLISVANGLLTLWSAAAPHIAAYFAF